MSDEIKITEKDVVDATQFFVETEKRIKDQRKVQNRELRDAKENMENIARDFHGGD